MGFFFITPFGICICNIWIFIKIWEISTLCKACTNLDCLRKDDFSRFFHQISFPPETAVTCHRHHCSTTSHVLKEIYRWRYFKYVYDFNMIVVECIYCICIVLYWVKLGCRCWILKRSTSLWFFSTLKYLSLSSI